MIFSLKDAETRKKLQADGFLPAKIIDLFIGDQFIWDSDDWGKYDRWLVIDREDKVFGHYDEDTDSVAENVLVSLVVMGEDEVMHSMTINGDHETWMLQSPKNADNPLLYNHRDYMAMRLTQAS